MASFDDLGDYLDNLHIGTSHANAIKQMGPVRTYRCTTCNKTWYSRSTDVQICFSCSKSGRGCSQQSKVTRSYGDYDDSCSEDSSSFGEEEEDEKQLKRRFGFYRCNTCNREWCSASSWEDNFQKCKYCLEKVFPHKQTRLRRKSEEEEDEDKIPHQQELCGKCKEIGRNCMDFVDPDVGNRKPIFTPEVYDEYWSDD